MTSRALTNEHFKAYFAIKKKYNLEGTPQLSQRLQHILRIYVAAEAHKNDENKQKAEEEIVKILREAS